MVKSFKKYSIDRLNKLELLESVRDEITTGKDVAFKEICEASLSRLWSRSQGGTFAILTAYRGGNTKDQNVSLNRKLRGDLNSKKLGPHSIIGHWQECSLTDAEGNPVDYNKCPRNKLVSVVERSYFVTNTETSGLSDKQFSQLIFALGKAYQQDGVVLKVSSLGLYGVYNPRNGQALVNFSSGIGMNRVAQAYSQHIKKQNVPFVFEGVEKPTGGAIVLSGVRKDGFYW